MPALPALPSETVGTDLMLTNAVKGKLSRGEAVIGVFLGTSDARFVELCGYAGFDYVLLDAEHFPLSDSDVEHLVRAAEVVGIPAFVRVAANRPEIIRRVLDVGAWGVMIPQVRSAEEATAAVAATKYAPLGTRGAAVSRVAGSGTTTSFREWAEISNRETMVIIQIETREAVDRLNDILQVEGVDAFEIGRSDLSQSLGLPGLPSDLLVRAYVDKAVETILQNGRVLGDTTDDQAEAAALIASGYRMVACHLDRLAIQSARKSIVSARTPSKT
jgi:4-hydroxy-2-oxoheptanedioate aldolase